MCDNDSCCSGGGSNLYDAVMLGMTFVVLFAAFPAIPAAMGGWYIGAEVIGNNFAKWGLSNA